MKPSETQPSRRSALRRLRQALRRERRSGRWSPQELALARLLRDGRERIAAETGCLWACARCAGAYPPPASTWDGGYCCSGSTDALFDELELAALYASGSRPRHLRPPRAPVAGCIFRGPRGCSLPPRHRPNKCLRFLCRDAQRELHLGGSLETVVALAAENERQLGQLAQLREARLEERFCKELLRHLR